MNIKFRPQYNKTINGCGTACLIVFVSQGHHTNQKFVDLLLNGKGKSCHPLQVNTGTFVPIFYSIISMASSMGCTLKLLQFFLFFFIIFIINPSPQLLRTHEHGDG